jgi:hypothetical protein
MKHPKLMSVALEGEVATTPPQPITESKLEPVPVVPTDGTPVGTDNETPDTTEEQREKISVTGPLAEVYTQALQVVFAKKNSDVTHFSLESQAMQVVLGATMGQAASLNQKYDNSVVHDYDFNVADPAALNANMADRVVVQTVNDTSFAGNKPIVLEFEGNPDPKDESDYILVFDGVDNMLDPEPGTEIVKLVELVDNALKTADTAGDTPSYKSPYPSLEAYMPQLREIAKKMPNAVICLGLESLVLTLRKPLCRG